MWIPLLFHPAYNTVRYVCVFHLIERKKEKIAALQINACCPFMRLQFIGVKILHIQLLTRTEKLSMDLLKERSPFFLFDIHCFVVVFLQVPVTMYNGFWLRGNSTLIITRCSPWVFEQITGLQNVTVNFCPQTNISIVRVLVILFSLYATKKNLSKQERSFTVRHWHSWNYLLEVQRLCWITSLEMCKSWLW